MSAETGVSVFEAVSDLTARVPFNSTIATADLTEDEARRLTEHIRLTARTFAESRGKLMGLVAEAKARNAHAALGYPSWTAYLSDVLADEPLRLARDDRKEMVGMLAGEGMSTRAIAPIVGVSPRQVAYDLSTAQDCTVERPPTVTSLDGRERPSSQPETSSRSTTKPSRPEVLRNTHRIDANRVIATVVLDASNVISPSLMAELDLSQLDRDSLGNWISSLQESISALAALKRNLKRELTHDRA